MPDDERRVLGFDRLASGEMPAISAVMGQFLVEAAAVCFDSQGHKAPASLSTEGDYVCAYEVSWPPVDDQVRRTHNDLQTATEHGACGVACALAPDATGLDVVLQAKKGGGFDYWLGKGTGDAPFADSARLEVSGILKGSSTVVAARVSQKLRQTDLSDGKLPAYAIVVEFSHPRAVVKKKT